MKSNQRKIGALLSYAVIALNMIVGLVYTPFLIRKLGQAEYGLYSIVYSVMNYLKYFTPLSNIFISCSP